MCWYGTEVSAVDSCFEAASRLVVLKYLIKAVVGICVCDGGFVLRDRSRQIPQRRV